MQFDPMGQFTMVNGTKEEEAEKGYSTLEMVPLFLETLIMDERFGDNMTGEMERLRTHIRMKMVTGLIMRMSTM